MEIRVEQDVVLCRQRARQYASALGFEAQAQIRIATALSEIARNAFQYTGGGRVEFFLEAEPALSPTRNPRQSLVIQVQDSGTGIARLDDILGGRYQSQTGLGLGILGAHRLMDRVEISSTSSGTFVTLRKTLPPGTAEITPPQLQTILRSLSHQAPSSVIEEMQLQNQELIQAINEVRARNEEIERVNHELAQTNAGVMALYDELETLHRVGNLLASKLDLKSLIQSIIDATTELTSADIGAFYLRDTENDCWMPYASAGVSPESFNKSVNLQGLDFFGRDVSDGGATRVSDTRDQSPPPAALHLANAFAPNFVVRSLLAVPMLSSSQQLHGSMIFVSSEPNRFTERSERIIASIAVQAVVGIEKSQLFHAVQANSEAKDRFLAMLSHELRTPLNPVLATVSSWQSDTSIPEFMREEISMVARNVRLEARLIDDLLDFSKLTSGKLQIDMLPVDVHAMIESVLEICREDFSGKFQNIEILMQASAHMIEGDASRLQQVLWNVLKNAIKFTPELGKISIRTSNPTPANIRIVIRDNGLGIEPQSLSTIFGAFEQGRPQILARFGGLGLGLSISKTFVEKHGGTIVAASDGLGSGAVITIELPVSHLSQSAQASSKATNSPKPTPTDTPSGHILLVEDHIDTIEALSRLLIRKGHAVTKATSCAEARAVLADNNFDLIISDLGLPDSSGLQLISDIRMSCSTPAIALSGYGMDTDIVNSRVSGFNAHLTKPIDFENLISVVNRLLTK